MKNNMEDRRYFLIVTLLAIIAAENVGGAGASVIFSILAIVYGIRLLGEIK